MNKEITTTITEIANENNIPLDRIIELSDGKLNTINKITLSALISSFNWYTSDEGFDYWDKTRFSILNKGILYTECKNDLDIKSKGKDVYMLDKVFKKLLKVLDIPIDSGSIYRHYDLLVIGSLNNKTIGTSDTPITFGEEGSFWLKGNSKNKIKLSKILQAVWGITDPARLEHYISKWKSVYTVDISKVTTSADISGIYDMKHPKNSSDLAHSCMRYKGEWMRIYEDLNCKVAYIEEDDILKARALVWEVVYTDRDLEPFIAYDRIFAKDENARLTLKKYFKENNYLPLQELDGGIRTVEEITDNYEEGVPYIDTMSCVTNIEGSTFLTNGETVYNTLDILQRTEGGSDDGEYGIRGITCDHCGETVDEYRVVYVENVGVVCEYCLEDNYVFCEDIDRHVPNGDAIWVEDLSYYVSTDCYGCGYYVYLEDRDYYVSMECEYYVYLEDYGEYYSTDYEHYLHSDGLVYSYPEDEDEEEEGV